MQTLLLQNTTDSPVTLIEPAQEYALLLEEFGLPYRRSGIYLQVGDIASNQGWVLHLTSIISQVPTLIRTVAPYLADKGVPFEIIINKGVCDDLLIGTLGLIRLGKVICIYPHSDDEARGLAMELIELTKTFKGPSILTDVCLGGVVFVQNATLPHSIPFGFPEGLSWPFQGIGDPNPPAPPNLLQHKVKLLSIVKSDCKGDVFNGLFLKGMFSVKKCITKQGRSCMSSDDAGRDMHDRLVWQYELYNTLKDQIPMPAIYSVFIERGDTYLVSEFISGRNLYETIKDINPQMKSWFMLGASDRKMIVRYLQEVASIVQTLHGSGFVHRDIVPSNFMVADKGRIFLLDMELCYSLRNNPSELPYRLGTAGFMSPEQLATLKPTIKEDSYGFGGLMLEAFTGLTPIKFDVCRPENLYKLILLLTSEPDIASLVTACLSLDPKARPNFEIIKGTLTAIQSTISRTGKCSPVQPNTSLNSRNLRDTIAAGMNGLIGEPTLHFEELWYSLSTRLDAMDSPETTKFSKYRGLADGNAGVVYLLAKLHKFGFNIHGCLPPLHKAVDYVSSFDANTMGALSSGLYSGRPGIAVALACVVEAELVNHMPTLKIDSLLQVQSAELDLANGLAGVGLAILQCITVLPASIYVDKLEQIVTKILNSQHSDGSWTLPFNNRNSIETEMIGIGYDCTGIIWFLLEYQIIFPSPVVEAYSKTALGWLLVRDRYKTSRFGQKTIKKAFLNGIEISDQGMGVILVFIRAYQVFGDHQYKLIAEELLNFYPEYISDKNLSQQSGLSGLGELYLEAGLAFQDGKWIERAHWIATLLIGLLNKTSEESGYWQFEENNPPTASLFNGSAGVIHFLLRCLDPQKVRYRLLR